MPRRSTRSLPSQLILDFSALIFSWFQFQFFSHIFFRLSSVCDVGAPYSHGWTFLQYFATYCNLQQQLCGSILWRKHGENIRNIPKGCHVYTRSMKTSRFSTYISLYLANNTRFKFQWKTNLYAIYRKYHFQWPWLIRRPCWRSRCSSTTNSNTLKTVQDTAIFHWQTDRNRVWSANSAIFNDLKMAP